MASNYEDPVTLIPEASGELLLRVPGKGRCDHLQTVHGQRMINASIQPHLGRLRPCTESKPDGKPFQRSLFQHPQVFRHIRGPMIGLEATAALAERVRKAVMDRFPDPLPEWLSGHTADGRPTSTPHMAVAPLADTGYPHADGHLLGFALWLPNAVDAEGIEHLEDAVHDQRKLTLGRWGSWEIEQINPLLASRVPVALRTRTYTKPHQTWASVTSVVFDRYPKCRPGKDATTVLGVVCERI